MNLLARLKARQASKQWQRWWDARIEAMEKVLGKMDDQVLHAMIPFVLGSDIGGAADVVSFSRKLDGIAYVTSELIGNDDQVPNKLGNYELMICHRTPNDWGPEIISRLAHYSLEKQMNPGETMDIGPTTPEGSTIVAFLFLEYARFRVREREAGLLLCLGITQAELDVRFEKGSSVVEQRLKECGVYPYTDLSRPSVFA